MHYSHQTAEELLLNDSFLSYCKGGSPADEAYWQQLLKDNPEQLPEADRARELFHLMQGYPPVSLKAAALERLKLSLDAQEPTTPVRSIPYRRLIAVAASVVVIATASWMLLKQKAPAVINYNAPVETGMQDRRNITLPDGTTVLLSTASRLHLSKNFGAGDRQVLLEGEAYFKVTSDASHPFIVATHSTTTTVLGTEFKVRGYGTEAQVMLASGKVRVQHAGSKSVELKPGEEVNLSDDGQLQTGAFERDEMRDWLTRRVEFSNAGIKEISAILEEYYGVKVRMEKEPAGKVLFTGVFHDQQLKTVLDAISFTNNFTYHFEKNEVVIRF